MSERHVFGLLYQQEKIACAQRSLIFFLEEIYEVLKSLIIFTVSARRIQMGVIVLKIWRIASYPMCHHCLRRQVGPYSVFRAQAPVGTHLYFLTKRKAKYSGLVLRDPGYVSRDARKVPGRRRVEMSEVGGILCKKTPRIPAECF